MIEQLKDPSTGELNALTDLWERSVRTTHDFLASKDIPFFREIVRKEALPAVELYIIRHEDGPIAAFAGISDNMLEMLFVSPEAQGTGLGRQLVEYAVAHCGVRRVDVNEQNSRAAGFYARLGFRVTGRDAIDPTGRPYPILHLTLDQLH